MGSETGGATAAATTGEAVADATADAEAADDDYDDDGAVRVDLAVVNAISGDEVAYLEEQDPTTTTIGDVKCAVHAAHPSYRIAHMQLFYRGAAAADGGGGGGGLGPWSHGFV